MFKSNGKLLSWSLFIVLIDQLTKIAVLKNMHYLESVQILGDFLRLTFIKNPGIAFGIEVGNKLFFTIFAAIASLLILIYLFRIKPEDFWSRFALASILGGAIGNLIDRILYQEVIDFIDIRIIHWPVFNVADIAVTVGMVILIASVIFNKQHIDINDEQLGIK
ncbi:MAG: signal peptidase II [bacterium]|nr:signal peptidase II [bacterium]